MKRIQLTKNKFAVVDDFDFEELSKYSWCASDSGNNKFYAHKKSNSKTVLMHRLILNINDKNVEVDHINHNTLDNRRCNLRVCSRAQNNRNKSSHKNSTSKYLGVSLDKARNKWRANIYINKKCVFLGRFEQEKDAALAYDNIAKIEFKEYANLNFKNK
jgi:hypothetical protein